MSSDPEFVLYDATTTVLHVYRLVHSLCMALFMRFISSVKPAIFDLFLAFAIAIYLSFVYLILNVVSLLCVGARVCACVCACVCVYLSVQAQSELCSRREAM